MTIVQRLFRARTVYIVALAWIVSLVLFLVAGGDKLPPDSPVFQAFMGGGTAIVGGTMAFAIWQFVHWAQTRPPRPPGRLSRSVKVYGLAALCAALAVTAVTYPVMSPAPTADQMIEVQGTVTSVLVRGSGSGRRADFVIGGQSLLFWADRGYGRLAKGCEVRFFVQAAQGQIKQAPDGSVHARALADDGESVETLQAALRRESIYQVQILLMGFVLGALAIFFFRMDPRDWKEGPQPEVHVPPPAAPSNKSAA